MNQTDVFLREHNRYKRIKYSARTKPSVSKDIIKKWQDILNATAELLDVPAGLIMRINETHLEVFLKSDLPSNPYTEGDQDSLGHGLYCETVIGEDKPLHIPNALQSPTWQDNPDIKLNMIAYYGLPIKWKDGEVFGTICVLDNTERHFSAKHRQLLELFKAGIETDLHNLELIKNLRYISRHDPLTNIPNRRHILSLLETTLINYKKEKADFTVVMIDIKNFKQINDNFGHQVGDDVLKAFAKTLKAELNDNEYIGRIGGDEFLMVLNHRDNKKITANMDAMAQALKRHPLLAKHDVSFACGLAPVKPEVKSINELINKADRRLVENKRSKN